MLVVTPSYEARYPRTRLSPRLRRAVAALVLCVAPLSLTAPARANPVVFCTPVGSTCAVAGADLATCDEACVAAQLVASVCTEEGCVGGSADGCDPRRCGLPQATANVCVNGLSCVALEQSYGGIEQPATGTITISEDASGTVTHLLTGVFDPATGDFTCTLTAPAYSEKMVRCVPNNPGIDWYCAGWVVTATGPAWTSQAAGQASCADHQGYPGTSSYQTLWTQLAMNGATETATATGLSWFVSGAITCSAWGYSAGPRPLPPYTVTCDEPGANAPR